MGSKLNVYVVNMCALCTHCTVYTPELVIVDNKSDLFTFFMISLPNCIGHYYFVNSKVLSESFAEDADTKS